jgi:hypothetical protein
MGTGVYFPGVKRLGCEADHSPPSKAEAQTAWSYTSIHPYVTEWDLAKFRDKFYLVCHGILQFAGHDIYQWSL